MSGGSSRRYPPELRERAVRMVAGISDEHGSEWAAISEVARLSEYCGDIPPVELETAYYAQHRSAAAG
jgi:hypothetical protein